MAKNYAKEAAAKAASPTPTPAPAPAQPASSPAKEAATSTSASGGMQRGWKLILDAITKDPNQNMVAFVKLIEDWLMGLRPELQQALLQRWSGALNRGSAPNATVNPNPPPQAGTAPPGTPAGAQAPGSATQRPAVAA